MLGTASFSGQIFVFRFCMFKLLFLLLGIFAAAFGANEKSPCRYGFMLCD